MGKEAKIGMAVIFVLFVVFSVVLFKRLNNIPRGPSGEAADAKAKKESPPEPKPKKSLPKGPSLSATAPKIVSARSGSDELSKGPKVTGLEDWSVVSDAKGAKKKANRNESGPPSPFPMLVGAAPQGAYASGAVSQTAPAGAGGAWGYAPYGQQAPGLGQPGEPPGPQLAQRAGPFATNTLLNSVRNTDPQSPRDPYTAQDPRNPLRNDIGQYQSGGPYRTPGHNGSPRSTYRTDPLGAPGPSQGIGPGRQTDVGQALAEDGSYLVQPNDNYWTISERLYGTGAYFQALAEHNRKKHPDSDALRPGEKLSAPGVAELEKNYRDFCPKPEHRDVALNRTSMVSTTGRIGGGRVYVVQEGDTLFDIARYELGKAARWAEIFQLNRKTLGDQYDYLTPGIQLVMPVDQPAERITQQPGTPLRR